MLISNRAQQVESVCVFGLVAIPLALTALIPGAPGTAGDHAGRGFLALVFGVAAFRCYRIGLDLGPDVLTIRRYLSTRFVPWDQVRNVTIVDSGNATGRANCVAVILTSGELVRISATASYRLSKVQKMLGKIQQYRPSTATS